MSTMPVTFQERIPIPVEPTARPGGGAAAAFSASDVIRALKQRVFLVLFLWIFLTGTVAVATYVWMRYWPGYVARATVLVESPKPQMPYMMAEQAAPTPDVQERYLLDQQAIVKMDDVLQEVLRDNSVINTHWYQSYSQDERPEILLDLQDQLNVAPLRGTSLLQIAISCHYQDDPAVIVNSVVEKYLAKANQMQRTNLTEQLQKYKEEKEALDRQIREIRTRKESFVTMQLGAVPGVTQGLNVVAEELRALTNEATRLESERIQYKAMYDNLAGVAPRDINISPQMRMMIENDPKILSFNNALSQLHQQRASATKDFGDSHRQVRSLDAQIAAYEKALNDEMAAKEDQVRRYEVDQAQMAYLNATEADLQLKERVVDLKEQQKDLDRQLALYQSMEEEQVQLQKNYDLLTDYIRNFELMLRQSAVVRVQPVASAVRPIERSTPRWELNVPIGAFLALVVAVGVALLLEFADTSVRTPRDLVRFVRVPILGTVPDVDDEEVAIERVEMAAQTSPRSLVAEAFRTIRTNLLLSAPAERQRTVLVTSPKPGDGKTTIATNLAISIAQSGRRVLLVDANFRRPAIHQLFPDGARDGLSNALIGQARLEDLVHTTTLPNLDVLLPGPIPPNPAELLGGKYIRELMTQAAERYDQVIFDGPPVLLVTDALVLAGIVDGVIMVCRAKANSRGIAQRAREQLERVNAHLFGAVLNAAQVRRGGYFREQLRTFYEYQPEELPAGMTVALPHGGESGETPGGNATT